MWRWVSYGMGFWNLTHDLPDDAVRVWMLPHDWDTYDIVYLLVVDDNERLDILSELLEISSN